MSPWKTVLLLTITFFLYSEGVRAAEAQRYALAAGANNGGKERVMLKYAVSDASAFLNVMRRIGGIKKDNSELLVEPDADYFIQSLKRMRRRISGARKYHNRIEFIFYYSGHSDEKGILLGGKRISYKEIRNLINTMKADIKIVVLDSCSSGAFTRVKGGKMRSAFSIDSKNDMKGYAFMTSSSADEVSQESDKIRGSFFTHYFLTGLKGAADHSRDGRITLNEAYHYAYKRTLYRTSRSMGGAQHPNFRIKMVGTGDVIMTDITSGSTSIALDKDVSGTIVITDTKNNLIAEFNKPFGVVTEFNLDEGEYHITNEKNGILGETAVTLYGQDRKKVTSDDLKKITKEDTLSRGKKNKRDEYLITPDNFVPGGYLSISPRFTMVGQEFAFILGIRASFIMNHVFSIGVSANVLLYPLNGEEIYKSSYTGSDPHLAFGYGGIHFEFFITPVKLMTISLGSTMGMGASSYINLNTLEDYEQYRNWNIYFAAEPEVGIYLNVARFLRVGIAGSYRFIAGTGTSELTGESLSNFSLTLHIQFGWF